MMSMMMAHMNAAAAAAAAAAMGIATDSSTNQPTHFQNQSLIDLPPTHGHHTTGYGLQSQLSYTDYSPNSDEQPHIRFLGQQQHQSIKTAKMDNLNDCESDDEDSGSVSLGDDTGKKMVDGDGNVELGVKMSKKICRVCGDKALGYNFNVVSCESCKAFFRRNALKKKEFRCPFNDSCEVTAVSRRFCQKCRLRKCFEVGMKKEWIMSDEARLQKRARIEENRRKRTANFCGQPMSVESQMSPEYDIASPPSTKKPVHVQQQQQQQPQPQQQQVNQASQPLTNVGFSPQCQTPPAFGTGGSFSPPDSNASSKTSISPLNRKQPDGTGLVSWNSFPGNLQNFGATGGDRDTKSAVGLQQSTETQKQTTQPAAPTLDLSGTTQQSHVQYQSTVIDKTPQSTVGSSLSLPNHIQYALMPGQQLNFGFGTNSVISYPPTVAKPDLDDSITIPKSVLISLINQCHSTPVRDVAKAAPIVARAERLVLDGCSNDDLAQCICRCACGARSAQARIGIKTTDKCVGPEDGPDGPKSELVKISKKIEIDNPKSMEKSIRSPESEMDDTNCSWSSTFCMNELKKYNRNTGSLTALENWKLRELCAANRVMMDPLDKQEENNWKQIEKMAGEAPDQNDQASQLTNTIHLTDICVRRIIKMCKRLSAFSALCQDDQIALLKGGCTELMLLRGVMTFVPEKESWRPVGCKDTLLSLDVLKGVKGNVYEEHRKFLHSFREEWRRSDSIMLTISAITLFNPRRSNVVHVQSVQMEQDSYLDLLQHYLDIMYGTGTLASSEAYRELLLRVEDVGRLNDYAATIFLEVNPTDVEPLLIEIFDLK